MSFQLLLSPHRRNLTKRHSHCITMPIHGPAKCGSVLHPEHSVPARCRPDLLSAPIVTTDGEYGPTRRVLSRRCGDSSVAVFALSWDVAPIQNCSRSARIGALPPNSLLRSVRRVGLRVIWRLRSDRCKIWWRWTANEVSYKTIRYRKRNDCTNFSWNGVTLRCIWNEYDVCRIALKYWIRQVRKKDMAHSNKNKECGSLPKKNKLMARPKKKEPETELEKLQADNLRLRAEIALLKKWRL